MAETWNFYLRHQEARARRLILEGEAVPPYERPYHDPLVFYAVVGTDFFSFEVSRDFDGERLLEYFHGLFGAPVEAPRVQVGGRQDEEEGAMLVVEWRFTPNERDDLIRRLGQVIGQTLGEAPPARGAGTEER